MNDTFRIGYLCGYLHKQAQDPDVPNLPSPYAGQLAAEVADQASGPSEAVARLQAWMNREEKKALVKEMLAEQARQLVIEPAARSRIKAGWAYLMDQLKGP